jgi:pyruvate dehydrogenase E2 component (dihydrolipoamide acetyltransferase)
MAAIELKVPDIGDFSEVEVIELLIAAGDQVTVEQSLITVESDKASMEIPSTISGRIVELRTKIGDKVKEGSVIAMVEPSGAAEAAPAKAAAAPATPVQPPAQPAAAGRKDEATGGGTQASASPKPAPEARAPTPPAAERAHPVPADMQAAPSDAAKPHASPSVRKFARELGVDLQKVTGTGPKQRITQEDVQSWVKAAVTRSQTGQAGGSPGDSGAALGLIPWPKVDFEKFGPVERKPLSRIKKLSAANLHRNWVMIPHVTNQDEADITDLEAFRVALNKENEKGGGVKLTMLAFVIQACVHALKKFPEFNASLDGDNLVLKRYYHIGFAADTPNGLVVPVVRDADRKGLADIAQETAELARKARDGKLSPAEMQGGTFSISSLGGIGGTGFTPIINAPEVAILGVSRSSMRPVWDGRQFSPRLTLPLSLSYDHRVIDGAAAARFNAHLLQLLGDFRRVSL